MNASRGMPDLAELPYALLAFLLLLRKRALAGCIAAAKSEWL
jgi:hypothetical protein